jgi:RWD domain
MSLKVNGQAQYFVYDFNILTIISVIDREPIKFQIKINTEEFLETDDGLTCDMIFTFTAKYPEEAPKFEIEEDNVRKTEKLTTISLKSK